MLRRWSSTAVAAWYIRAEEAGRGAVARYYQQVAWSEMMTQMRRILIVAFLMGVAAWTGIIVLITVVLSIAGADLSGAGLQGALATLILIGYAGTGWFFVNTVREYVMNTAGSYVASHEEES